MAIDIEELLGYTGKAALPLPKMANYFFATVIGSVGMIAGTVLAVASMYSKPLANFFEKGTLVKIGKGITFGERIWNVLDPIIRSQAIKMSKSGGSKWENIRYWIDQGFDWATSFFDTSDVKMLFGGG